MAKVFRKFISEASKYRGCVRNRDKKREDTCRKFLSFYCRTGVRRDNYNYSIMATRLSELPSNKSLTPPLYSTFNWLGFTPNSLVSTL